MEKLDTDLFAQIMFDITERINILRRMLPEELLKHLAATSIHLAFFARDIAINQDSKLVAMDSNMLEEFLNKCGCDFNKINRD